MLLYNKSICILISIYCINITSFCFFSQKKRSFFLFIFCWFLSKKRIRILRNTARSKNIKCKNVIKLCKFDKKSVNVLFSWLSKWPNILWNELFYFILLLFFLCFALKFVCFFPFFFLGKWVCIFYWLFEKFTWTISGY